MEVMYRLLNNSGYTYLEMLFVLMITASIITLFTINFIKYIEVNAVNQAIDILTSSYNSAQLEAIATHSKVKLVIDDNNKKIDTYKQDKVVDTKEYSNRVEMTKNGSQSFKLNNRGNLSQATTVDITSGNISKKVSFSIGVGGYNVK